MRANTHGMSVEKHQVSFFSQSQQAKQVKNRNKLWRGLGEFSRALYRLYVLASFHLLELTTFILLRFKTVNKSFLSTYHLRASLMFLKRPSELTNFCSRSISVRVCDKTRVGSAANKAITYCSISQTSFVTPRFSCQTSIFEFAIYLVKSFSVQEASELCWSFPTWAWLSRGRKSPMGRDSHQL